MEDLKVVYWEFTSVIATYNGKRKAFIDKYLSDKEQLKILRRLTKKE